MVDEPAGTRSDGQVLLTSGVRYAAPPPGWADPTLDLYLPPDSEEHPVAVIVPDAGATPESPEYVALAHDLAARGVLTVVVRWGVESPELRALAGRAVEDVVETVQEFKDEGE